MRLTRTTTLLCAVLACACASEPTTLRTDSIDEPLFGRAPAAPANPELAYGTGNGLAVANADGSNATIILPYEGSTIYAPHPSWAPGGNGTPETPYRMAYNARTSTGCDAHRLDVIVDPATRKPAARNVVDLTTSSTVTNACYPKWSPAGDWIAFSDLDYRKPSALRRMDPSGLGPVEVLYEAPEGYRVDASTWSPDASKIAFVETDVVYPYPRSIKVLDLTTTPRVATTVLPSGTLQAVGFPDWSRTPGSTTLLVRAETGTSGWLHDVWEVDVATGAYRRVTEGRNAAWSPTDDRFVYTYGNERLAIYTRATSKITTLTNGARTPDWR
jgi:hypothetical protein